MTWLRDGVPITLIADLAARGGPLSREILAAEAVEPDCAKVLPPPRRAAEDDGSFSRASGS